MGLNISDNASDRIISIEDIDKRKQWALATSVSVCLINIALFLNLATNILDFDETSMFQLKLITSSR